MLRQRREPLFPLYPEGGVGAVFAGADLAEVFDPTGVVFAPAEGVFDPVGAVFAPAEEVFALAGAVLVLAFADSYVPVLYGLFLGADPN